LPCYLGRGTIIKNLLKDIPNNLKIEDINEISDKTEGFSGSDISILVSNFIIYFRGSILWTIEKMPII